MRLLVVLGFLLGGLSAGDIARATNVGGVLLTHHPRQLSLSTPCDSLRFPSTCDSFVSQSNQFETRIRWFVLAAFPGEAHLKVATFALGAYDNSRAVFADWGPCGEGAGPIEIAGAGWPAPNTGTAVCWSSCREGEVIPLYWFASYAYAPVTIPLVAYGSQNRMADCAVPAVLDTFVAYGSFGFGGNGALPCSLLSKRR